MKTVGSREPSTALDPVTPLRFWIFAWLAFLPIALARAENLSESDTFWQVRTGLLTVAERRIPAVDPFSWTASGEPWTLNSWGFNVLMAAAYEMAGLVGVALAGAVFVAVIGGLVLFLARSLSASPVVSAWLLVLVASPLLIAWWSARPHLVDYVAVLLLVIILRSMLEDPSPWHLSFVGLLTILWVNLHAASLLGVAIIGAAIVLVCLRRSSRGRIGWFVGAGVVALASTLANPYGAGIFYQTAQVKAASTVITEWQPLDPANPLELVPFILGLGALVVALRRRDIVFSAALLVMLPGSVVAIRILPILLLVAVPVLMSSASHPVVLRYFRSRRRMLAPCGAVGIIAVLGLVAINLPALGRPDAGRYPVSAIRAIPEGCRLFNGYVLGGLVMLERPDVKVSLDSRNDLYGAELVTNFTRFIESGDEGSAGFLTGADCVLIGPNTGLARSLRADPGWKLEAAEAAAELFTRVRQP